MPTVPTFAVRETDIFRHNGGTSGAPLKPFRDDSALRALSSLRGLRGALKVPPLCREMSVSRTANVGTVGKNRLKNLYPLAPQLHVFPLPCRRSHIRREQEGGRRSNIFQLCGARVRYTFGAYAIRTELVHVTPTCYNVSKLCNFRHRSNYGNFKQHFCITNFD